MTEEKAFLFNISVDPENNDERNEILYNKGFSIVPDDDKSTSERGKSKSYKQRCFNCGSDEHQATGCSEEFDRRTFLKNKAQFMMEKQQQYQPTGLSGLREFKRYHIESAGSLRVARPGIISDELREALGIDVTQLPPYIYKMRELGYPPGWLEEAKISKSGIKMINSKGERVPDKEEEEGEICVVKTQFDFAKIVDYPGFNVWPSADTVNETDLYGARAMHYSHSKEVFCEYLKQLEERENYNISDAEEEAGEDMDAEEIEPGELIEEKGEMIPPLPADEPPSLPPPPPTPPEDGEIITSSDRVALKRRCDDDHTNNSSKSPRSSLTQTSIHEWSEERLAEDTTVSSNEDNYQTPNDTLDSSFGRVISVELSTPSLKTHSSFVNLPPPEAFRKDISDVVQFENLPNSTGKYEQLKTVLKKVRDKLNVFRKSAY